MKYIYIRNRGSLDRQLLELIGISTKRDRIEDDDTRGHKGSGKKLAAIAALRAGIATAVTSVDDNGCYFLDYVTEEVRSGTTTVQRVDLLFRFPEHGADGQLKSERKSTGMCLDAFAEWDRPVGTDMMWLYKPVREHVIDAADEDEDFEWGVCEERAFAHEGETTVYLEYDDTIELMLSQPLAYFKDLSDEEPLVDLGTHGEIWRKSEPGCTRLFLQRTLLDCDNSPERTTVFDYSLNEKGLLSEDRTLKSADKFEKRLALLLARLSDVGLCKRILAGAADGSGAIEKIALGHVTSLMPASAKAAWVKAAGAVFGQKLALHSPLDEVANQDAQQIHGYTVLQVDGGLRKFLRMLGVPTTDMVIPKAAEDQLMVVPFEQFDAESRENFLRAFRSVELLHPGAAQYPIYFFVPLSNAMRKLAGFSGEGDRAFKEIWIQAESATRLPPFGLLREVLRHERRHCKTRKYDHERGFMAAAEDELNRLTDMIEALTGPGMRALVTAPVPDPIFGKADRMPGSVPLPDDFFNPDASRAGKEMSLAEQSDAMLERIRRDLDARYDEQHPEEGK